MTDLFNQHDTEIGFSTERRDSILIVTLRRGPLNTLPPAIHRPIEAVWDAFEKADGLRVAILTAEGDKSFSAGSDISAYNAGQKANLPPGGGIGLTSRPRMTKPIIAAVNGLALGGGLEIMLACDMAIAAEHAVFGLPEVKLGAAPLGGGAPRIVRKIPHTIGLAVALGVQRLNAEEALRYGLINAIAPRGQALEKALEWAQAIVDSAPIAVAAVKEVADMALDGADLNELLQYAVGPLEHTVMESADMREGMAAFLEKRKPVWTGK
jgi:enoyl-CoA hydratase/carnithine racemase